MVPGSVILFKTNHSYQFGQVTRLSNCEVEFKILHSPSYAIIKNWFKAYLSGDLSVIIPSSPDTVQKAKTITVTIKSSYKEPSRWQKTFAKWEGRKYSFDDKSNTWRLKAAIKGTLFIDGWFVPFSNQIVKNSLYFIHHNKTEVCLKPMIDLPIST